MGESGLIMTAGVLIPIWKSYSDDPDCQECGTQCKRILGLVRFAANRQADFVSAVERKDFDSIVGHSAPAHEDDPELSLRVMSCPKCGATNVLTVNRIAWVPVKTGGFKVVTKPLVNQLIITKAEAELIKNISAEIQGGREAGKTGTAELTGASGEDDRGGDLTEEREDEEGGLPGIN